MEITITKTKNVRYQ